MKIQKKIRPLSSYRTNSQEHIPVAVSVRTRTFESFCRQEIRNLESKLDEQELKLENYHVNSSSSPIDEIKIYKDFLQHVSLYVKQKSSLLGNSLNRGLGGIFKSISKLTRLPEDKRTELQVNRKAPTNTKFAQTENTEDEIMSIEEEDLNLDIFLAIRDKIRELKVGKVTGRLKKLLDNLKRMHTDVPEQSEVHETLSFDSVVKEIKTLKQDTTGIEVEAMIRELLRTTDKSIQTDLLETDFSHYLSVIREKENEIFELNTMNEILRKSSGQYQEQMKNGISKEMEAKCFNLEKQLIQSKTDFRKLEETHKNIETENISLKKDARFNEREYKKIINDLVKKNKEKVDALEQLENELFEAKINSKIAETKLEQLEEAWVAEKGESFTFKDVDRSSIIQKHGIVKNDVRGKYEQELSAPVKLPKRQSFITDGDPSSMSNTFDMGRKSRGKSKYRPDKNYEESSYSSRSSNSRSGSKSRSKSKSKSRSKQVSGFKSKDGASFESKKHSKNFELNLQTAFDFAKIEKIQIPSSPKKAEKVKKQLNKHLKELTTSIEHWETSLLSSIKPENQQVYNLIKTGEANVQDIQKKLKVLNNSISVQYEQPPILPKSKSNEKPRTLSKNNALSSSASPLNPPSPSLQKDPEIERLRGMHGLLSIFNRDGELENLPPNLRIELFNAMHGHKQSKCGDEICKHLLRAMNIRSKARGIPYPLKQATLMLI